MRRRVLPVLVAGVLAACSNGSADDSAPSSTTAEEGGLLRLGIARLDSLDPTLVSPDSPSASIAADLLFDGLTTLAPGSTTAAPGLASEWTTADGGVTWQFTLDAEATFSDGSAVTAAATELSIERVLAQGQASLVAGRLDAVTDVSTVGPASVQLTLSRPMASLPELLAAPAYGIVPPTGVDSGVSSGPFRLAGTDGDVMTLTRAAGRSPVLDQVDLHQYDDLGVALDDFADGELDWTLVPPSRAEAAAEEFGSDGFVPFQAELFYGFNLADPRFADPRFRQAIVQAIDREAIVQAVYLGTADPLAGVIPDGVPGFDPSRCAAGCAHDPAAAAALLAQAFPAGGVPEVPIDFPDGADEAAVAGIIEQNLEAVGIPAVLRPHPAAEYSAFAVSGQQGFASLGWIGVQAIADDYVARLFRSGSVDNFTGFTDPAVDALIDQASISLDPAERIRLLGEAERAILALAPIAPLAQFRVLTVQSPEVESATPGVTGTFPPTEANVR